MNSLENDNRNCKEEINRKNTEIGDGFDHTLAKVEDSFNTAKTFIDGKVNDAKTAVENVACDANTLVSEVFDKTISSVNDGLEIGKQYIADQHLEKIADNFSGVIKKYPIQSLLAGLGMGILIGNIFSRR